VRTLTGKEIELDIEKDYKACSYGPYFLLTDFQVTALCYTPRAGCTSCSPTSQGYKDTRCHELTWYSVQVARIKERVEEKEGIPPVQQRLIYGGKQMYAYTIHHSR
jgi:hypothetical protein